jgi:zinc protease
LNEGVTEAELDKAKTRFLTGKLLERETNNGKASALGEAAVIYRNPDHVNTDLAEFQAVTTDQIKEVMNRYLTGKKTVVIEYLPEATNPASGKETEKKS